ncbi:MAG: hypothetical protein OXL34_18340 [Gemmatimonadota bacterium]|nr:hypothetical protein [Gemmatimonadota bacterium]
MMPNLRIVLLFVAGAGVAGSGSGVAGQDRPVAGELTEVYRVGGLSAPEWAQFVDPSRMGFDASGNLYVLDTDAYQVVVIGAGGDLVMTVGREGEGPGEFRAPADIVVWRDGHFGVVDMMHGAYQLFTPDGGLERFVRMSSATGEVGMAAARATVRADPAGGAVIAEGASMGAIFFSMMAEEIEGEQIDVVGENGKLERLDLSGQVAVAESIAHARQVVPMSLEANPPYFAPRVIWDVLPDGTIAYFDSTAYEINLVGVDGGSKGVLERPLRAETVTDGIRSAVIRHLTEEMEKAFKELAREMAELMPAEEMEEMPDMDEQARERAERTEFYAEIPVLRGLRATWDGSLWVQRRGEDPWDHNGPIDVLGADGEYRGTLAPGDPGMPEAFGPGGLVAFVELDEMDVPTIVVRRLPAEVR